jgi:hypothetical protein
MRSFGPALVICGAFAACDDTTDGPGAPVDPDPIPVGHPCPELAFTPLESRSWEDGAIAPLALRLPTPSGDAVRITQGNNGMFSHFGREQFAWDFGVPAGTPVHAAAAGVVVWVEDTRTLYGPEPELRDEANFVVLDHGAGLFTAYVHLALNSALVRPGDLVAPGEVLAQTGLSGQMTGPHLHFHVENVWSESLPARFATPEGCALLPAQDEWVTAWEVPLAASDRLSLAPADAFAEDGVIDVHGLPARLLERDEQPLIRGATTLEGATVVWFLVLPASGGTALFAQDFAVHGGRFEGRLELSGVAAGQYGVALVASPGGAVSVPRSVRLALVE